MYLRTDRKKLSKDEAATKRIRQLSNAISLALKDVDIELRKDVEWGLYKLVKEKDWQLSERQAKIIDSLQKIGSRSRQGYKIGELFGSFCALLDFMMRAKLESYWWRKDRLMTLFHFTADRGALAANKIVALHNSMVKF